MNNHRKVTDSVNIKLQRHAGEWHVIRWGDTHFPQGKPSEQPKLSEALQWADDNGYQVSYPTCGLDAMKNPPVMLYKQDSTSQEKIMNQLRGDTDAHS